MGEFFLGFALGLFTVIRINSCVAQQDATDEGVERRAKAVYERRATSLDWYEGSKHLEPWTKLSDAEHEAWLRPLRKY